MLPAVCNPLKFLCWKDDHRILTRWITDLPSVQDDLICSWVGWVCIIQWPWTCLASSSENEQCPREYVHPRGRQKDILESNEELSRASEGSRYLATPSQIQPFPSRVSQGAKLWHWAPPLLANGWFRNHPLSIWCGLITLSYNSHITLLVSCSVSLSEISKRELFQIEYKCYAYEGKFKKSCELAKYSWIF